MPRSSLVMQSRWNGDWEELSGGGHSKTHVGAGCVGGGGVVVVVVVVAAVVRPVSR